VRSRAAEILARDKGAFRRFKDVLLTQDDDA